MALRNSAGDRRSLQATGMPRRNRLKSLQAFGTPVPCLFPRSLHLLSCGMARVILFNKPFNVLSQFTDRGTQSSTAQTLSDYVDVPHVYAAGRLDKDSEGLLVLTDDGALQHKIAHPKAKMRKTYFVQVEGRPDASALQALRDGVVLKDGRTKPALVEKIATPAELWPRTPPVRFRKSVPDSWIEITLREGRNRQVRRMTAHVGHPTLRLIRWRIGPWDLSGLPTGTWIDAPDRAMEGSGPRNPRKR